MIGALCMLNLLQNGMYEKYYQLYQIGYASTAEKPLAAGMLHKKLLGAVFLFSYPMILFYFLYIYNPF